MLRGVVLAVSTLVLAGCSLTGPIDTAAPSAPSAPPVRPAPSATAALTRTPAPTSVPVDASPAACVPFDLAHQSEPAVYLSRAAAPDRDEAYGLNGNSVLGSERFEVGAWHQPAPASAYVVDRSEPLLVTAQLDVDVATCLDGATVDAAPFSSLGLGPSASSVVRIASSGDSDAAAPAFAFDAPSDAGEWVVRVALTFATTPGPSRQESFFRLRIGVAAPSVAGRASAPWACARAGSRPPAAYLSVDGGPRVRAAGGSFTWGMTAGDGPAPLGPSVEASRSARIAITTQDRVCAGWWQIELAPKPEVEWEAREPFLDLIAPHLEYESRPAADPSNRFELAEIPPGDWVIEAFFEFPDARGRVYGQTSGFWNIVVR